MKIVIVGGGTAGWIAALMVGKRHPYHEVVVIESSKIGIIGVGESTTGRMTDILINLVQDFGCNHDEFIVETGSTLKYGIRHKGWTNNINRSYFGPIFQIPSNFSYPRKTFSDPRKKKSGSANCDFIKNIGTLQQIIF